LVSLQALFRYNTNLGVNYKSLFKATLYSRPCALLF
jgi:hypothetical protein